MNNPAPAKRAKKKPNHERWVISYADLLTLLLAFFVVLYASSTHDKTKLAEEAASLLQAFHGTPHVMTPAQASGQGIMPHNVSPRPASQPQPASAKPPATRPPVLSRALAQRVAAEMLSLQKVEAKLKYLLSPLTAKNQVVITAQPLTLTIQLNAAVLFPDGKAQLMPDAVPLIGQIARSLAQLPPPFTIVVQGYTDDKPINTAQFPSNWSLSVERSVSVVALMQTQGVNGAQLAAEGFAEFAPIADNKTAAGRAQNRRVIFVVHAPDPNGQ